MHEGEVIAIALLIEPGTALSAHALALNARLRSDYPQGLALDATHVPHISILHRYVYRAQQRALEAVVGPMLSRPALQHMRLRATGCEVSDWHGELSVVISVARTPALQMLQTELERALAPFAAPSGAADAFVREPGPPEIEPSTIDYVAKFVPERLGEGWSPHVTIGSASAQMGAVLRNEKFPPFEFEIARFAVYQLGNKGTARRRLWPR